MKNNSFQEIWNKLKSCRKILITLHLGPDGDSLGSCAAMKLALEREGIEVKLVSKDFLPENLKKISFANEVEMGRGFWEENLKDYDAILLLDIGSPQQVNVEWDEKHVFNDNNFYINIDHHKTNKNFGSMNYVDLKSSVCSILIDLFDDVGVEIDKELAKRLMLGLATDSNFFTIPLGTQDYFIKASRLVETGFDYYEEIVRKVIYSSTIKSKMFQSELYKNIKIFEDKKFAYSTLNREALKRIGLHGEDIRLAAHFIKDLDGMDFIFTLIEFEGYVKGSFRGTSQNIDVSVLAESLGGGGHRGAAGFVLKNMSLKEAEEKTLEVVDKYLKVRK